MTDCRQLLPVHPGKKCPASLVLTMGARNTAGGRGSVCSTGNRDWGLLPLSSLSQGPLRTSGGGGLSVCPDADPLWLTLGPLLGGLTSRGCLRGPEPQLALPSARVHSHRALQAWCQDLAWVLFGQLLGTPVCTQEVLSGRALSSPGSVWPGFCLAWGS